MLSTRPEYDPRADGALCDRCSLNNPTSFAPVPSELRENAVLGVFAEAPGRTERTLQIPLCGKSGNETMQALRLAGLERLHVSLGNVCCCQPPGNDMNAHLLFLKQRNAARERNGKPALLSPLEACWPRMLLELHTCSTVLLMGAHARAAVYSHRVRSEEEIHGAGMRAKKDGSDTALMSMRGYPDWVVIPGIPERGLPAKRIGLVSTIHPAFAMRKRRWTYPFRWDVAKSVRLATGTLRSFSPEIYLYPTNEQLLNYLSALAGTPAYDIETNGRGAWRGEHHLRCIGIGNHESAMVVPYKSVQRAPVWGYSRWEREERDRIVCAWFAGELGADPDRVACDQNGQYDLAVLRAQLPGFQMGRRRFDTVIAHHVAHSEYPHDLGFQTSQYTDRPAHKDVDHNSWQSDEELHAYNAFDVATTSWNAQCLALEPDLLMQREVFANDMFLSQFCLSMHELGLEMNIVERDAHYKRLSDSAEANLARARDLAVAAVQADAWTKAKESFASRLNPNSPDQMKLFLYDMMGVTPIPSREGGFTDSGEPSVSKDILFSLMDKGISDQLENFLLAVIDYREDIKLRGTYCTVEPARDGRVHPNWSPHTVVSGRLSCSDPNVQNIKKILRSIYSCRPGHILVAWDYAQIEARIMAWLARQWDQIAAFQAGADIHRVNACAVLGIKSVEEVSKGERQFTKTFVYAVQYLAAVEKVHQMLRNFRAADGSRPYRDIPFKQVQAMFGRFWGARDSIMAYHEANREFQYANGYLADDVMGRIRRFLDAAGILDEKEEKANTPVQFSAAAVVNTKTRELYEAFPPGFDGPYTGIIHQGHDSLMVECREEHAREIARRGKQLLYYQLGEMPLPVDSEVGYSFGWLKEFNPDA